MFVNMYKTFVLVLVLLLASTIRESVARKLPVRRTLSQDNSTTPPLEVLTPGEGEVSAEYAPEGGTLDEIQQPNETMLVGVENITVSTNGTVNETLGDTGFVIVPELTDPLEGETVDLLTAENQPVPDGNLDVLLPNNEFDADPDDLQPTPP